MVQIVTTALKWLKVDLRVIRYKQCQQGGEKGESKYK